MFLVTDLTITPEPDDIERGHIDPETIVYFTVEEALASLTERVRFSLAYELDEDNPPDPEPPLPLEFSVAIDLWRAKHDSNRPTGTLRIDSRDYQHLLIPLGAS